MAIETMHPGSAVAGFESILMNHYVVGGCAPMIAWPSVGDVCSAVLEFDGDLSNHDGFHVRIPDGSQAWQIQANQYLLRLPPPGWECWRRPPLDAYFREVEAGIRPPLAVDQAWELLRQVVLDQAGLVVQHAIVYEPDKKIMHVAFSENGRHAPFCSKYILDVAALIQSAADRQETP